MLKTIKNYAMMNGVTAAYIYKLIKANKIERVTIDGVQFVDLSKFPTIHK